MAKRIWEIETMFRCPIIGFCLSASEQKQIIKKTHKKIKKLSDFDIHEILVKAINDNSSLARRVEKVLNQKYKREIAEWGGCPPEEWRDIFDSHYDYENLGALIWISAVYIILQEDILVNIYGKIHTFSHIKFHQQQDILKNLSYVEKRYDGLQEKYLTVRNQLENERKERRVLREENVIQKQKLITLSAEIEQLQESNHRKKVNSFDESLQKQIQKLEQKLKSQNEVIERVKVERNQLNQNFIGQNKLLENMQGEFDKILAAFKTDDSRCGQCDQYNLCERKVLIVGGICKLRTFYEQLVKQMGGKFEYHDGRLDNNDNALTNQIGRSDIVICPVDINSHAACLQVKQHCKKLSKPYFMLHNSGVSSVYKTLQELARAETN